MNEPKPESKDPYRLKFHLSHKTGSFDEQNLGGWKGADGLFLVALRIEKGELTFDELTIDGQTGEALPDVAVFRAWIGTATRIAESPGIPPPLREIAKKVVAAFEATQAPKVQLFSSLPPIINGRKY